MNHTVTDAFGIDSVIKRIQEQLYKELDQRWSPSINGYGRVYKNPKKTKVVPEAYKGGREYSDVFFDDGSDVNFFFIVSDESKTDDEVLYKTTVKLVFCMNLEKCFDGSDRMDALAHKDAVDVLRNLPSSGKYIITGYQTGLERIFAGFSILGIKYDDMQPYHCFAVLLEMNYKLTDKCS